MRAPARHAALPWRRLILSAIVASGCTVLNDPWSLGGCPDLDEDGFTDAACGGDDCDDGDPSVSPSALDRCGGGDQDCDGRIDEDPEHTFYRDADRDGFGVATDTVRGCSVPVGYAAVDGDCDDAQSSLNPDEAELCDGLDNDCDGTPDLGCPCTAGMTQPCGPPTDEGECTRGEQTCDEEGAWRECVGAVFATAEVCEGQRDDDCDGSIDEAGSCECTNGEHRDCRAPGAEVTGYPSICNQVRQFCVNGRWPRPCEEENLVAPMTEVCDGTNDEDCDGVVDPGCSCTNGASRDCGTNTGECTTGRQSCSNGTWSVCSGVNPVTEVCDHLDNDCNSWIDNGFITSCGYEDTNFTAGLNCRSDCSVFGTELSLGWPPTRVWQLTEESWPRNIAYLPTPTDWGLFVFNVSARAGIRRFSSASLGHGAFGVVFSPRNVRGSESAHGLPQLSPGQIGFAARYLPGLSSVQILELRPDADPVARGSTGYFGCGISTTTRQVTVSLKYALLTLTATVSSPGCATTEVTHTITEAELERLYGFTTSYPRYYPGVFGNDVTGGTVILVNRFEVEQAWGCQGCPWTP